MRQILLLAIAACFFAGCGPLSQKEMNALNPNGILYIKIPCKTAEWEAITTVEEGGKSTVVRSRIYFREGRFRFEILDPQSENKQVILFDKNSLYVLGYDNKAYMYGAGMREAEVFLRKIFVNTGVGRKAELKKGEAGYNGQKCQVYEYEILRNVNGLYAKTIVREWRNNKGATVKMETAVGPAEFRLAGRKIVVGPIKETYVTSNYKCGHGLLGMLFEVPLGMKIVNQQDEYMKQLKKSGKKITPDAGLVTMTVKSRQKTK